MCVLLCTCVCVHACCCVPVCVGVYLCGCVCLHEYVYVLYWCVPVCICIHVIIVIIIIIFCQLPVDPDQNFLDGPVKEWQVNEEGSMVEGRCPLLCGHKTLTQPHVQQLVLGQLGRPPRLHCQPQSSSGRSCVPLGGDGARCTRPGPRVLC